MKPSYNFELDELVQIRRAINAERHRREQWTIIRFRSNVSFTWPARYMPLERERERESAVRGNYK